MNNLIQAITAYTTALEQKLAALEARVAQLEASNEAMRQEGDEAKTLIATLQAEVAALAATGVAAAATEEPEVEIELIIEDEPQEELVEETQEEIQEETKEPQEILDEPAVEVPVIEPAVERVVEPVVEPQPAPAARTIPQQTSLFGPPVKDIRQAISLGDRFLFQRELFVGNGELMQKTLDEINKLGSFNEAIAYISNNFDWDHETTAVKLFINVLNRRFG